MSAEDSPISFDEDDDERMRRVLDETEYDTELGMAMAKDAQRVTAGELSEAEFYTRYHDRLLEEFDADDREFDLPEEKLAELEDLAEEGDGEGLAEMLTALVEDGELPRREVMMKGGFAAGALTLGLTGGRGGSEIQDEPASTAGGGAGDDEDEGTQWGMVINLDNCDGCLACVSACNQENNTSRGANWMYVFAYEDERQEDRNFLVRPCQHCSDSPCTKVCPVGARHTREEDGLVLTDYEICIGCRYCQVSCPYGVNYFQWGDPDVPQSELDPSHTHDDRDRWVDSRPPQGVMGKCTFCPSRQDGHRGEDKVGTTACEEACAMDAIHFGDLNDPESAPNQHLEQYEAAQANDRSDFQNRSEDTVATFQLMEERGTDPNVHYVGNEPSQDAEQIDGPVTYEQMGIVDNRKEEVLDNGAMAPDNGGESA